MSQETGDSSKMSVSEWMSLHEPVRRSFPGPPGASALLRIAFERPAYAEVSAHAKESLNAEVGGVLVGQLCEDDAGPFVQVTATVRADDAKQGRGHITFTHKAWDAIHATMEKKHPGRYIVGWYHTHPGFGVEFSAMDKFIHENFFAQPFQIALVCDPLGGNEAMCLNRDGGVRYLDRFWVDGRERRLEIPIKQCDSSPSGIPRDLSERLDGIETRLNQVIHALDEHRISISRWVILTLFLLLFVVCLGVAMWVREGMFLFHAKPPEVITQPELLPSGTDSYLIQPMVRVVPLPSVSPSDSAEGSQQSVESPQGASQQTAPRESSGGTK